MTSSNLKTSNPIADDMSLEGQLEYQKKLNDITNKIHSANDTNDILLNLQEEVLGVFEADRITIYVIDGIRKEIVSKLKSGDEINEIRVPIGRESIAGYCAATGEVINVTDAYDREQLKLINPRLNFDESWDKKTGYRTSQVIAAPIIYNKYLLGVVQLINKKGGGRFTEKDAAALLDVSKVLGIALYKNQRLAKKTKPTKYDYLTARNIISKEDLSLAMSRARKAKDTVASVLMKDFKISKEDIGKSLSTFYRCRFISYDPSMPIPTQIIMGLKPNFLRKNLFVPIRESDNKIVVAMEDPTDLLTRDTIRRLIPGRRFEYCVAFKTDILQMIGLFFDVKKTEIFEESGSIEDILGQLDSTDDDIEEDLEGVAEDDSAIVRIVTKMIIDAYQRGASDIHVEPRQGKADAVIRVRIDGTCQVYQTIPYTYKRAIISRIKIMADLDIAERRLPQDGKIKFRKFAPLDIELRVATIPTAGQNEDVVMRLLAAGEPMPLDKMGMSDRNFLEFLDIITKPYGIVLVVGPTGSGKTTTLHAALAYINKPETKIWTAEDPVEITQEGLRQVQVQPKIGFDFARAMRAFLRADPDVIMVGEMRDHETVSTGIEASLTGHLVFSTLHTNSAPETVTRLLDMGMDPFNFSDALLGVLAQRLVRTLCSCKERYHPTQKEFDALVRAYAGDFDALNLEYNDDFFLYRAKGCPKCNHSGYKGRTGIHELLAGTDEMKLCIQNKAKMEELRAQAIKDGMTTLMQDGIRKVYLGYTTLTEVRKVCIK
ncbi:MAG: GspE/PulE family protein [Desulfatiglans sp.]|jgi:type II secretory ATPase GspE/PulE/Tfp pilus assembly ATPase PilB-like protein|nr:GspE/PulE family protein [Thermodesulfobacteriota bacterium]MEE4352967.1 GspE/PulE family protein [Desulfatiglans sp.]